jgi:hypothetical protein
VVSPLPLWRFTAEYGEIEYGGLPVNLGGSIIMLPDTVFRCRAITDNHGVTVIRNLASV